MDVISSNAPYYISVYLSGTQTETEYNVYLGDSSAESNLIYTGKIYDNADYQGARAVDVDIQPILVNYTPSEIGYPYYYGEYFLDGEPIYQKFTVTYPTGISSIYTLNLYMIPCFENATNAELGWQTVPGQWPDVFPCSGNDYIQKKFINNTYFSALYMNPAGEGTASLVVKQYYPDNSSSSVTLEVLDGVIRNSGNLYLDSSVASFDIIVDGTEIAKGIEVLHCVPENTFILYYVNSFGGIDYLICDKNNSVTYNADRHTMTHYANITDRKIFSKRMYLNNSTRTWTLNTDYMTDEQSKLMYKVFNSPYMWLYDVDKQQINSVILEDKSLQIKQFRTDKFYNYTLKVTESQTFTMQ